MISCILLSAGLSERFGSPKALASIGPQKVIERVQNTLLESQVDEIIVVLGAHADKIKPYLLKHKKVKVVYNKDYNFGQTSSFQAGLKAVSASNRAVFLLPVDYPAVETQTIDRMIAYYGEHAPRILIPVHAGKKGHPPLFSMDLKDDFLRLGREDGINTVSHRHAAETVEFSTEDKGVIATFNTPEELDSLLD